jgi:hypothetical protein
MFEKDSVIVELMAVTLHIYIYIYMECCWSLEVCYFYKKNVTHALTLIFLFSYFYLIFKITIKF